MNNKQSKKIISIRTRLFLQVGAVVVVAVLLILSLNNFLLPTIYAKNEKHSMIDVKNEISTFDFNAGDYVSTEGNVLGKHAGHMNCTLGQSRGLGIALGRKMYVVSKNAETNTVVLGDKSDVMKKTVRANNLNLTATDSIPDSSRFTVKIRYGKSDTPASVTQTGEDEITAVFDEAVFAPAPGQSMVIYDGDTVIGGGIII